MSKNISVVISIYNEEDTLLDFVVKLNRYLRKNFDKFEMIIVEDKSSDKTPQIADYLARKFSSVVPVHKKSRSGFGNCIRGGFKLAKYDLVWYTPPDCPYDLKYLNNAVRLISKSDAVVGYRIGSRESFFRLFFSKSYNILVRALFGIRVRDVNFSFKLLRKEAIDKIDLKSNGWFIDVEILAELKRKKLRVIEIPIKYLIRSKGQSKIHIGSKLILGFFKEIIYYNFRHKV